MNTSQNFAKGNIADMYDYGLEKYEAATEVWPQLYDEIELEDNQGDYWQSTTVIKQKKPVITGGSAGFTTRLASEGFTVYGRVYDFKDAVEFHNNALSDIKLKNALKELAGEWGQGYKLARDEFYALPFKNGGITTGHWIFNGTPDSKAITDSSGNYLYDSVCFLNLSNNTRTSKSGLTHYNAFAYTLTPDNLITIINHGMTNNCYDDAGERFNLKFDTIVFPIALQYDVPRILESELYAHGTLNDKNPLQGNLPNRICWNELEDTDAFFVGCAKKGLIAIKREEPQYDFFADKWADSYVATFKGRTGIMIDNFRYWLASGCSTS